MKPLLGLSHALSYNSTAHMFKKSLIRYFLLVIFLAASWSLFSPQFFRVHDFTHAGRIAEMSRALSDGHFPVRWVQNFGYGYGMPLFEFYGPLPFYVGAAFYWLGLGAVNSIKILYLLTNIVTLGGGYLLGKRFFGKSGGLVTAAALTLAPYRAVNLFVRGALNETWAIAFLPWILLGVVKVLHRESRGWLLLTLSLTGLFLSHNITTLLFAPALGVFAAGYGTSLFLQKHPEFFRKNRFRELNFLRIIGQLIGSIALAVGLSAFYLFPAFLEKNLTQIESTALNFYFNYRLHFLYIRQFFRPFWGYGGSEWGPVDGISFFLGWGQLLTGAVLLFLLLQQAWKFLQKRKIAFTVRVFTVTCLFGLLTGLSLYMTLLKSQWVWEKVVLLEFVQFPWRWLGIAVVFFALINGSVAWFIRRKMVRGYLALLLVLAMAGGSFWFFRPERYLSDSEEYYYTDPAKIRRELSGILPDYLPAGMNPQPSIIPDGLIMNEAVLPADSYSVLANRTHEKLIRTSFAQETLLEFAVADYPGWRVEIDNQRWERQFGPDGNIHLVVPPGDHLVVLRFLDTDIRKYADLTSLVSWAFLFFLVIPKSNTKDPLARKKAQP